MAPISSRFAALLLASSLAVACASKPPPAPAAPTASPFVATKVEGLGDPEIIVENKSDLPLTLEVKGDKGGKIDVAPGQRLSLRIAGGSHPFIAYSAGSSVQPLEGEETFEADHRYVWVFTVKTIDPGAGAGWSCYEVGPILLACERTADACEARRNKPLDAGEKARPPCNNYPEPWSFVDSAEQAEWFTKDAATCEKARTGYLTDVGPAKPEAVQACHAHP